MNDGSPNAAAQHVERYRVSRLEFGLMSPDQVRRLSVVEVHQSSLYERSYPRDNGCNDVRMGTVDRHLACATCKNDAMRCPGHPGHIELALPVFHTSFVATVLKVLRCVCFWCSALVVEPDRRPSSVPDARRRNVLSAMAVAGKAAGKCPACGGLQPLYTRTAYTITHNFPQAPEEFESDEERARAKAPLTVAGIRAILEDISDEDVTQLGMDPQRSRPEWMVLTVLMVPPPCIRPSVRVSEGSRSRGEDHLTVKLVDIVKTNRAIRSALEAGKPVQRLQTQLQSNVAMYFDKDVTVSTSGVRASSQRKARANNSTRSLVGRLKGKRGRIRGNIMGKRVNFSSRSVITPDASLDIDCLGVPRCIAVTQTVPEMVNRLNRGRLEACVRRGAGVLGGASKVHLSGTRVLNLAVCPADKRAALRLETGMVVERALADDDWVVFNRQPTLHRESMMGHRVRIMDGLTFRLPVPDTTPYNADFDGDEMNMFTPQDPESRAEVAGLMSITAQMLGDAANRPAIGCVQDTVVGLHLLTQPDVLLEPHQFMDLAMRTRHGRALPQPAVLKPRRLYTGRQAADLAVPGGVRLRRHGAPFDGEAFMRNDRKRCFVRDGRLASGVYTKKQVGTGSGGLVHEVCLTHGNTAAVRMVSDLQRVAAGFLLIRGCSVGLGDCKPSAGARATIDAALQELDREESENPEDQEAAACRSAQAAMAATGAAVTADADPRRNTLAALVHSGSKGSVVNLAQIMGSVGQQTVGGRRVCASRTLTAFAPGDRGPEARGMCRASYYQGLSPSELFMHTASGREGLIDTAVKTASTGYVQRRLIKSLEQVSTAYDGTVRSAKQRMLQAAHGGNRFAPRWYQPVRVPELRMPPAEIERRHGPGAAAVILRLRDRVQQNRRRSAGPAGLADQAMSDRLLVPFDPERALERVRDADALADKKLAALGPLEQRAAYENALEAACAFVRRSGNHGGPPLLDGLVERGPCAPMELCLRARLSAARAEREGFLRLAVPLFTAVQDEIGRAVAAPGNNVGVIAATSIGAPITQMTLNSVDYSTHLVVRARGFDARGCIGAVVDALMAAAKPGDIEVHPNDTWYLPLAPGVAEALTVDENGRASWEALEAVTRHPPINKDGSRTLLKVTTESGRSVIATKAKSFLVVRGGKLVDIAGEDLRVGDPLPVVRSLPAPSSRSPRPPVPLTEELGRCVGRYLRGGTAPPGMKQNLQDWCNSEPRRRRLPVFAFDAPPAFVRGLLAACVLDGRQNKYCSKALAEGLALLLTRAGGTATLEEVRGPLGGHVLRHRRGSAAAQKKQQQDVWLDPVATIEEVEPSRPHVYDLTVAKTRNMVTESGLVQRDTFHHAGDAGKNVTLGGVPRFQEFLDATRKIKTPLMVLRVRPDAPRALRNVCARAITDAKLADLVWEPPTTMRIDEHEPYRRGAESAARIRLACQRAQRALFGQSRTNTSKRKRRPSMFVTIFPLDQKKIRARFLTAAWIATHIAHRVGTRFLLWTAMVDGRPALVSRVADLRDFCRESSDERTERQAVENLALHLLELPVAGVEDVRAAFPGTVPDLVPENGGNIWAEQRARVLRTSGTNIIGAAGAAVTVLDPLHASCNGVHKTAAALGVEAARSVMHAEVTAVIQFNGNYIHPKHIDVMVDCILRRGSMCPMTRHGMARQRIGVLMRASFETTTEVFNESACHAVNDNVSGITENIMFANRIPAGTGVFDIMAAPATGQAQHTSIKERQSNQTSRAKLHAPKPRWNLFAAHHELVEKAHADYFGSSDNENDSAGFERLAWVGNRAFSPVSDPDEGGDEAQMSEAEDELPDMNAWGTAPAASPEYRPAASPEYVPGAASPEYVPGEASPEYRPSASPEYRPAASPEYRPSASPEYRPAASPKYRPAASPQYRPAASPAYMPNNEGSPPYMPNNEGSPPYMPDSKSSPPYMLDEKSPGTLPRNSLPSLPSLQLPPSATQSQMPATPDSDYGSDSSVFNVDDYTIPLPADPGDPGASAVSVVSADNAHANQTQKIEEPEFAPLSPTYIVRGANEIGGRTSQTALGATNFYDTARMGTLFQPLSPVCVPKQT